MEPAFRARASGPPGVSKERQVQRPPVYNSEDYTEYLRKYCKFTGLQLYLTNGPDGSKGKSKGAKLRGEEARVGTDREMGLKQFTSISELLSKLKMDLHLSYHSFLKEFISEPNDGVTLLLDLLKVVQLSQTNIAGVHSSLDSKLHQSVFKKALADEHECLLCLKLCAEAEEGSMRLADHPSGLFTISVCVMSNFSKSRVLALQLLTKMCSVGRGHKQVSDAISMLRLRFGEPVRFKFLIGMLNSFNSGAFQISCLRFINTFIETAADYRERVHIQSDLEDAGFELGQLKRLVSKFGNQSELLQQELAIWDRSYIEVNSLVTDRVLLQRSLEQLRGELEEERRRREEAEERSARLGREVSQAKEKVEEYERRLREEGMSSSGVGSIHSDQDSGKHSDNSLVISSEDCWAEIDKVNQTYLKKEVETMPVEQLVRVVTVSSPSMAEEEQDIYVERDASQTEEVLVEAQTMAMVKPPRTSKVSRSSSYAVNQTYGQRRGGEKEEKRVEEESRSYSELPLPPSPRTSGRSSREGRRWDSTLGSEEETSSGQMLRRMPRPPVRRRHRGKPVSERPKSAPPEKYCPPLLGKEHASQREVLQLPDVSDGETSDTGGGTLETVSAKSINFVRPSQRLLEREQHKRLKRHKSFFNTESLFSKKSSVVRRAESFHQGPADYRLSEAKAGAREEARERAKSVDRLMPEDDPLVGRLIKSKSMEFLKSKILRRPSKASKKGSTPPPPRLPEAALLGRSMFELHRTPGIGQQQTRPYPDWVGPPVFPAAPVKERRRGEGRREELWQPSAGPPPAQQPKPYDWRQDTPFWRTENSRDGRTRSHHSATPPPTWTPPPPQQYHALPPTYPSVSIAQAVNSMYMGESRMYLPSSPAPPPYSSSPGDSLLEITELEDAPPTRDYSVYTHNPRILELPSGLY